jgi:hypothetical protein
LRGALERLAALARSTPPQDLRAWAGVIGSADGPLPLLGTGLRAGAFPALQWNGALLRRVGAPVADGLALVALASAPPAATEADVARGLAAGLAVAGSATPPAQSPAEPTLLVLAAAACAAVTRGADPAELAELPDLAAALMVVTTPAAATDLERDAWAGHALAAGWLTPRVRAAGLTGAPATYTDTVAALTGATPPALTVTSPETAAPDDGAPVERLLAALA